MFTQGARTIGTPLDVAAGVSTLRLDTPGRRHGHVFYPREDAAARPPSRSLSQLSLRGAVGSAPSPPLAASASSPDLGRPRSGREEIPPLRFPSPTQGSYKVRPPYAADDGMPKRMERATPERGQGPGARPSSASAPWEAAARCTQPVVAPAVWHYRPPSARERSLGRGSERSTSPSARFDSAKGPRGGPVGYEKEILRAASPLRIPRAGYGLDLDSLDPPRFSGAGSAPDSKPSARRGAAGPALRPRPTRAAANLAGNKISQARADLRARRADLRMNHGEVNGREARAPGKTWCWQHGLPRSICHRPS
ncbi:unnamed protein product [Symbiodinium natans]|uniref:Uncharacterized protein n=1 Tax=Symbiodinium natans TaxID=878477 RepID=A0A812GS12_9DINO|nr:unnamed protein product [Symbiodinium natans]